jgi:hypothetical protein
VEGAVLGEGGEGGEQAEFAFLECGGHVGEAFQVGLVDGAGGLCSFR